MAVAGWAVLEGKRKAQSSWPETPSTCCPSPNILPFSEGPGPAVLLGIPAFPVLAAWQETGHTNPAVVEHKE
eukprot:2523736-Prorocentrum_lima.AAC.1